MAKKTKNPSAAPALVVAPPPPAAPPESVRASARKIVGSKHPLDPRENPAARDSRGSASRAEIRRETSHIPAPRQSARRAERHSQPRSKIAKAKAS